MRYGDVFLEVGTVMTSRQSRKGRIGLSHPPFLFRQANTAAELVITKGMLADL